MEILFYLLCSSFSILVFLAVRKTKSKSKEISKNKVKVSIRAPRDSYTDQEYLQQQQQPQNCEQKYIQQQHIANKTF